MNDEEILIQNFRFRISHVDEGKILWFIPVKRVLRQQLALLDIIEAEIGSSELSAAHKVELRRMITKKRLDIHKQSTGMK